MPADVRTNGISVTKSTAGFLAAIGIYSEGNRYDALFLSNYVDLYIRDALRRVPGVGNVILFGERKFAMRLWLDPDKLAARGLTPSDVVNALREQNVQVAAGIHRRRARRGRSDVSAERARAGPAERGVAVRERRGQRRRAAPSSGSATSRASSSAPRRTRRTCASAA